MDPRERADATLARAAARGAYVVTPESAISPMDATSTLQIPRSVVTAADRAEHDPEATMVVAAGMLRSAESADSADSADEGPAITQEASTQVLASPPGARRAAEAKEEPLRWAPPSQPPAPPPEPEHVEGLIPTVKQPPAARSSLSQRLDG